jgi:DNA modification methylase
VVTSPPYWGLRDYGHDGQLGLEQTPEEYVARMVGVFREVRRVLADDGTLWLNLGDSYSGGKTGRSDSGDGRTDDRGVPYGARLKHGEPSQRGVPPGRKPKELVGIPWRVAFALQADGWFLRQDIIWAKPNPMPESVRDRCTKAHEYLFLLTKRPRYYYDADAVREDNAESTVAMHAGKPVRGSNSKYLEAGMRSTKSTLHINGDRGLNGRNRRSVWTVTTKPFRGAHFAVMPEALVEPCVLAGSAAGDTVLDPFAGSGTVGVVALRHGRNFVGVELNRKYADIAQRRIEDSAGVLAQVEVLR